MAKLYPPNIKGIIPAFYGTTLVVPFSMNKAVGFRDILGFEVKIKTISGIVKVTQKTTAYSMEEYEAYFTLPEDVSFEVGQFYKIQIAYISKTEGGIPGYYSTVGIAKYTTEPDVYIDGLQMGTTNTHIYNYVGVYNQLDRDTTEKLYSSRFVVYDENRNIYKDSDEIIHNTTADTESYESTEEFSLWEDLEDEKVFYIQFSIKTINLMELKTPMYRIKQRRSIDSEKKVFISADMNYENGYMNLHLSTEVENTLSGMFKICRSDSRHNFLDWEEIFDFEIPSEIRPEEWQGKDFTVEQGVYYKYSIQQYNINGVYSDKNISDIVYADFEDSFLYDGEHLLNIRFNPKVSSFKVDLQESKQETIGSKYPYIFRNGHINYKEFPISGLISYLSDKDELFTKRIEYDYSLENGLDLIRNQDSDEAVFLGNTQLTSSNISIERDFKLKVLEWLTNGKPKLFKSPAEGNYIVRLLNVSLSPVDAVGRMLHSFSCTAYEVMEYSAKNILAWGMNGMMNIPAPQPAMKTVNLAEEELITDDDGFSILVSTGTKTIYFEDLMPGTLIKLDNNTFVVGSTGNFHFEGDSITQVAIKMPNNMPLQGVFTYSYNQVIDGYFSLISSLETKEVPIIQFFGDYYSKEILINRDGYRYYSSNLLNFLQDARTEISKIYMVRLIKRDYEEIFIKPEDTISVREVEKKENANLDKITFYRDIKCSQIISNKEIFFKPNKFYVVRTGFDAETKSNLLTRDFYGYYVDALDKFKTKDFYGYLESEENICYAIDGASKEVFEIDSSFFTATVNDTIIDLTHTDKWINPIPELTTKIVLNKGVVAEISFVKMISHYTIEEQNPELRKLKETYLNLIENASIIDSENKYYLDISDPNKFTMEYRNIPEEINSGRIESSEALREAYYEYIQALSKALADYKKEHDIR